MMSTAENTATEKRDVYATVTAQIINAIENRSDAPAMAALVA